MPTTNDRRRVIVTCDAESDGVVLQELEQLGLPGLPGTWLDTGDAVQGSILLLDLDSDFNTFSDRLESFGSIFVRHLMPVDYERDLAGTEADIQTVCTLVPDLVARIDPAKSFSVQSRILGSGKLPYRKVVLNETLSQLLEAATGTVMDCRRPQQVVSVLCTPSTAYVGLSLTEKNRSAWPGGKHRFKRDDNQVSRAEFKLLEAMSVFGIELPHTGRALDIGASPGGWTRLLAEQGLQVDAVDPGDLDARICHDRLITHYRQRIQIYSPGTKRFSAIVNDMKMDARDSIEIMLRFADTLRPDGIAVMTLKMPKLTGAPAVAKQKLEMLQADLGRLASGFDVIGARQLYHNRSEVTVAMRSYGL